MGGDSAHTSRNGRAGVALKIFGDFITEAATQRLFHALKLNGYQALFVGGCVRNAVLGMPVNDVDLATDALPETVTNIAELAGFRVVPTGMMHGTVTVIADDTSHEVTTFRQDMKTDGRHAVVAFCGSIGQDAARRDFTMNALYADGHGDVIDPLGGLPDLLLRRVRFVGDAGARIREDYLRILRFFRFYALYGDPDKGIDPVGLAACAEAQDGLSGLSPARIGAEFRKFLAAPDPSPAIASMAQAGVLAKILPGANPQGLGPLIHLESDTPPRWQRRLAVIGGQDVSQRLDLSRAETTSLSCVRAEIGLTLTPAALGWRLTPSEAEDVVLCRAAMLQMPLQADWQAQIARGAGAKIPVTAADLMPVLTGPELGKKLRQIERRWLASDLTLTKAQLLA